MKDKLRDFINTNFSDDFIFEDNFRGEQSFYIKPDSLIKICQALYDDDELDVKMLSDMTSFDWLDHEKAEKGRFEVVYNFYSIKHKYRFFIKIHVKEASPQLESLTTIWRGAEWMEREIYDLMGIVFKGHPDLRKILTPDELEGHPLRKDFPLTFEQPHFSWNKDDPPEIIK